MTTQDLMPLHRGRALHHARLLMTRRLLDAVRATPRADDLTYARDLAEFIVTEVEEPVSKRISTSTFARGVRAASLSSDPHTSLRFALEAMGYEVDE